jgi:hypothetical protein
MTVYESIVAPPLLAGAEKTTEAVVVPVAVALTIDGAPEVVTPLLTEIDKVVELEFVELVAVTVKVIADSVTVGVPLMTPVEVEKAKPVGSVGEIDQEEAVPPEFVGVTVLIAVLIVKLKDDEL